MLKLVVACIAAVVIAYGLGHWNGGVVALREHNAAVEATNARVEAQASLYNQTNAALEMRLQGALNELQKETDNSAVCIDPSGVRRLNNVR